MKIFLDSADVGEVKELFDTGLIDGVTTNPTLIRKSGRKPDDVYQELADMGIQDISMEVSGDRLAMLEDGHRLAEK
jgi:transaldolase